MSDIILEDVSYGGVVEECALPGQKVWSLTNQGDGEDAYLPGLFSSKESALQILAEYWIGEEEAAAIVWTPSPDNPEFLDGVEPSGRKWLLVAVKVDEI